MVHAAQPILVPAKNGFGHFPENIDADYVADMLCTASSLARGVHVFRFRNEARAREVTWVLLGACGFDRITEFNSPYYVMVNQELDVDSLLMSKSGVK